MESFSSRLKTALQLRDMKQSDLSRVTKIDKSQISSYVAGRYKASGDNLYRLAKALNVSESWLLGYDVDMYSGTMTSHSWNDAFIDSLSKLLSEYSDDDIAEAGLSPYELQKIVDRKQEVSLSEASEIADRFGCSLDSMINGNIDVEEEPNERESNFLRLFSELTEDHQNMIIAQMRGIIASYKNSED